MTAPRDRAAAPALPLVLARNRFMAGVEARLARDWNIVYANGLPNNLASDAQIRLGRSWFLQRADY